MLQNDLFPFGQTQPRWSNLTHCKLWPQADIKTIWSPARFANGVRDGTTENFGRWRFWTGLWGRKIRSEWPRRRPPPRSCCPEHSCPTRSSGHGLSSDRAMDIKSFSRERTCLLLWLWKVITWCHKSEITVAEKIIKNLVKKVWTLYKLPKKIRN